MGETTRQFSSFSEFYPFYLSEHTNSTCRRLHIIGSSLVILTFFYIHLSGDFFKIWILPLIGYGFAWVGHFFFEKNKPATFKYPVYSFLGDWKMWYEVLTSKRRF